MGGRGSEGSIPHSLTVFIITYPEHRQAYHSQIYSTTDGNQNSAALYQTFLNCSLFFSLTLDLWKQIEAIQQSYLKVLTLLQSRVNTDLMHNESPPYILLLTGKIQDVAFPPGLL